MGKSVIGEQHPFYMGVYEGAMGRDDVRRYVEDSDCVIMLGAFMTDINLGIYTAQLDPARSEEHTSELQSQSNLVCRLLLEKKKLLVCFPATPATSNRTLLCLLP